MISSGSLLFNFFLLWHQRFFYPNKSFALITEEGKIRIRVVLVYLLDGLLSLCCFAIGVGAFRSAYFGGLNQGVISTCFALEAVFVALMQRQRCSVYLFLGSFFLIISFICIGFSEIAGSSESQTHSPFVSVAVGVAAPIVFTGKLWYNTVVAMRLQLDSLSMSLVSTFMVEPVMLVLQIIYMATETVEGTEFLGGSLAGIL